MCNPLAFLLEDASDSPFSQAWRHALVREACNLGYEAMEGGLYFGNQYLS